MKCRYQKEEKLIAHYNKNVNYYSTNIDEILAHIGYDDLNNVSSAMDLGCGDGRACFLMAKKASEDTKIVGVDYSAPRIEKANRKNTHENVSFVCEDIHQYLDNLIEKGETFDLVVANEVIEHLENPREVLDKLQNISKWIVGTVPINLPYIAHLSVWPKVSDIKKTFPDFFLSKMGGHCVIEWRS